LEFRVEEFEGVGFMTQKEVRVKRIGFGDLELGFRV